jgi:hypothetical protein
MLLANSKQSLTCLGQCYILFIDSFVKGKRYDTNTPLWSRLFYCLRSQFFRVDLVGNRDASRPRDRLAGPRQFSDPARGT